MTPNQKTITINKLPSVYKYEKLYRAENVYDIIIVLDYNMIQLKKIKAQFLYM